jgi:hypothetical protein
MPEYTDQDGNDVKLCVVCEYWRATDGDLCAECAQDIIEDTMKE